MSFGVSLQEILETEHFIDNHIVWAGKDYLSNTVFWVHSTELTTNIKNYIHSGDLIITCGFNFKSEDIVLDFVSDLIEKEVAGLCIETVLFYHEISPRVIELAEKEHLPLIELTRDSNFSDIEKDLYMKLVGSNLQFLENLDYFDKQINSSANNKTEDFLKYTADYLNLDVAYIPEQGKKYFSSQQSIKEISILFPEYIKKMGSSTMYNSRNCAIKMIEIANRPYAYIVFYSLRSNISQFEEQILIRLTNKVKIHLLNSLMNREYLFYQNSEWIGEWLNNGLVDAIVQSKLRECGYFYKNIKYYMVGTIFQISENEIVPVTFNQPLALQNDIKIHLTTVKRYFDDEGLSFLGYKDNNALYFIIMVAPNVSKEEFYQKIRHVIDRLRVLKNTILDYNNIIFSFGKTVTLLNSIGNSKITAVYGSKFNYHFPDKIIFYDKLFILSIMDALYSQSILEQFVNDQLESLLLPENEVLLNTLDTYYSCNCSKTVAAEKLYIVRKTLYARLNKIAEIIGLDFEDGEKRLAVEFAIRANNYLNRRSQINSQNHQQ